MKETQVAVGISASGVDFDSPDGSLAHIVVLTLVPADDLTTALALYREILKTFRDERLREDLKRVRNYTEFLALLAAHKGEAAHDGKESAPSPSKPAQPKADLTVIVGARATARHLAKVLSGAHAVWLIDSNPLHTERAETAGLHALAGSALDDDIQESAHLPEASRLIALTGNSDINALVLNRAREVYSTPAVFMLQLPGADSQSHDHLNAGVMFGRQINLTDWDHWLGRDEIQMLRIDVNGRGVPELLSDLDARGNCLAMAVERPGEKPAMIPFSSAYEPADGDVLITARVVNPDG